MKKIYIWMLLYIASCGYLSAQDTKTYIFSFDKDDFVVSSTENGNMIESDKYSLLLEEDTLLPALPYIVVNILLPESTAYQSSSCSKTEELVGNNVILASNPQLVTTNSTVVETTQSNSYPIRVYPSNVTYLSDNIMDGYRYASFKVSPFTYNASTKILNLASTMELTISLEFVPSVTGTGPVHMGTMDGIIDQIIFNPEEISASYASVSSAMPLADTSTKIEYLIVTSASLKNAFQPLADWKTTKGLKAKVISTEEIYANYANETTNQLRIKRCLQDYYKNKGLKYVLLGGDDIIVPVQGCYASVQSSSGETVDSNIPTDLFYACFDKNFDWNKNGNNLIGENSDNLDLSPEIYISRIPVRTSEHVSTFVNRTLAYEQNPPLSGWYNKLLLTGAELFCSKDGHSDTENKSELMYNSYIKKNWPAVSRTRFYDTATDFSGGASYPLNATNLQGQLATGYHHVHMETHGNQTLWSMENGSYTTNNASTLVNNVPTIITTTACVTNAFDANSNSTYYIDPCLSEAFMRNPNSGVIAYWGSSRYGWGYNNISKLGPSMEYNAKFYENLFKGRPSGATRRFAAVTTTAKISLLSSTGAFRWLQYSLNAIGDPELPIYTEAPKLFQNVTYAWDDTRLYVKTGVAGCKITVMSKSDNGESYYQTVDNKSEYTFSGLGRGNFQLCITKDNYVPKVISDVQQIVYLQNVTYTGTNTIVGDKIIVGRNVTSAKATGAVTINSGTTTFQAENSVILNAGFTCKKGAELKVKIDN